MLPQTKRRKNKRFFPSFFSQDPQGQRGRREPARVRDVHGRVRRLRVRRPLARRAADTDTEEELPEGGGPARGAGLAPDVLRHAGRGHQGGETFF